MISEGSASGRLDKTIVFDLDGTLVDSVLDLADALNRLMIARHLPPFDPIEVKAMIGDGAAALVQRGFEARGCPPDATAFDDFLADYSAHAAVRTREFPGVTPGLAKLSQSGWQLAVCTNKPALAAIEVLTALRLDGYFAAVCGGDSVARRKPHPDHVLATLRQAGGSPSRAIMVGDHRNDVAAASGAGIPSIFAAWGYGNPAMSTGAAASATTFAELPDLADRLLGRATRSDRAEPLP